MPLPLPLPLPVTLIQLAPLVAVQLQPVAAVTLTLPLPALEEKDAVVDESAYVQGALTVNKKPVEVHSDPAHTVSVIVAVPV